MRRCALFLLPLFLVTLVSWAILPGRAIAFEADPQGTTDASGSVGFADPDDDVPGLPQVAPDVLDYQQVTTNPQLTPNHSGWIFSVAPDR